MEEQIAEALAFIHPILLQRDDLISGKSIFVLPSPILFKMNSTLNIFERNILLSKDQRETLESFYQVVSNIKKFELTQRSSETFDNFINLKKFKSLFQLNLTRICIDNILGIDILQNKLEILVCERCTKYRETIFTEKKYDWIKLRDISIKYMSLFEVEKGFFNSMPWIQDINLSHNLLSSVEGLETLDHLKRVNISFNRLDKIPTFSQRAQKRIEVLILNYNFITKFSGIEGLTNLKTFHISSNQLFDKNIIKCLSPLKHLNSLVDLVLKHNPVGLVEFYRIYIAGSLSPEISPAQFLLDEVSLSRLEQSLVGKRFGGCDHCPSAAQKDSHPDLPAAPSTSETVPSPPDLQLHTEDQPLIGLQSRKKRSKGRKVMIHDTDIEPVILSSVGSRRGRRKTSRKPTPQDEPNKTVTINCSVEGDLDSDIERKTVLVDATVHAADTQSIGGILVEESGNLPSQTYIRAGGEHEEKGTEEERAMSGKVGVEKRQSNEEGIEHNEDRAEVQCEETGQLGVPRRASEDVTELLIGPNPPSSQDDVYEDNVSDEDIIPWQVQRQDKMTGEHHNILLVLLENELKERSTVTGRTISRWPLKTAVSCVRTKDDPLTVQMEFDTLKKDKQDRLYVMEYPDAKVLLSRMSEILKTRRLSAMNHTTYSCLACGLIFVSDTPLEFKSKASQVSCVNCFSTHVIEIEEPRPPEDKDLTSNYGRAKADVAALKERTKLNGNSWLKHGSDIEVLSNWSTQSSSSIEVIPETCSTCPSSEVSSRKVSLSEEVTSPSPKTPIKSCTETEIISDSTSSGSLTESVVTQYEISNTNHNSKLLTEAPNSDIDVVYETEGETPGRPRSISEIYSYNNFTAVDERIASFIHQNLFETDEEKLVAFVKCHLWRTGGHDFDGCLVLSSSSVYFLRHSQTDFTSNVCDWLENVDSFSLTDIQEVSSLFWHLGARIIVKELDYLVLLMDKEFTKNVFNFLKDASSIVGIKKIQVLKKEDCKNVLKEFQLKNKIKYFTICLKIKVSKNNDEVECTQLGGLLVTSSELTVLDGDLRYLLGTTQPALGSTSLHLVDILTFKKGRNYLNLYFLDASEASETEWNLEFSTESQVNCVLEAIRHPWEAHCGFKLEVSITSEE